MTGHALEIKGLSAGYGQEAIVTDLNLDVPVGTITTLVGSNGAGKSTLLKAVYGLNTRFGGEILLHGDPIQELSSAILSAQAPVAQLDRASDF